jgi:hypothetical protein
VGCRAISPELVSLASRLEGRPFHLIATDRQRSDKDTQLAYLRGLGLDDNTPNFTVSGGGGHPGVKGNGYVPYYMIFDHRGTLVREHMGGAYHGGDGLAMIEWVEKLLLAAPSIFLGDQPFTHIADLAKRIESRKKLGAAVKELQKRTVLCTDEEALEEYKRLGVILNQWRDMQIAQADEMLATAPSKVVPFLSDLAKEVKGCMLVASVEKRLAELKRGKPLRDAIAIEKTLAKVKAALAKVKPEKRARAIPSARKKLEKAVAGKDGLPIVKTVQEYLAQLK